VALSSGEATHAKEGRSAAEAIAAVRSDRACVMVNRNKVSTRG
jgi:hypothetical protein